MFILGGRVTEHARIGGSYEILSEAHGPHWVAWVARTGDRKPVDDVLLVGQTREEAETRARKWAERLG
jgi:hypothetical protein